LWWFYHRHIKAWDDRNKTPWDTPSPYPHYSVLAFANTPFGMAQINPAECMPRNVYDSHHGFYGFRNRWQDTNDIVITQLTRKTRHRFRHGPDRNMSVWHHGLREKWGSLPGKPEHWQPAADGSAIVGAGDSWTAIDFSGASGAPGMLVMTGPGAPQGMTVEAAGRTYSFKFLTNGDVPEPTPADEAVAVGEQTVSMRDGKLVLGTFADPWQGPSDAARKAGARR
jgi:hypothetical protein